MEAVCELVEERYGCYRKNQFGIWDSVEDNIPLNPVPTSETVNSLVSELASYNLP